MKHTVFEENRPVGEMEIEPDGLYYKITAKVINRGKVLRLYGIIGSRITCIGIPDRGGEMLRRISKKSFSVPEKVILSEFPPQPQTVYHDFDEPLEALQTTEERECEDDKTEVLEKQHDDNHDPLTEIDNGGEKYETNSQNFSNDIDPLLLADLPTDYDYGCTGSEEAYSDHL